MDYKKKYEEALKRAKSWYNSTFANNDILKQIFPELKESEDENIRKELIEAVNGLWDNDALPMPLSVKRKDAWIAWLEKQGREEKVDDANKVKPKFKVGDYVAINPELRFASPLCIKDIDNNNYRVESLDGDSGVPTIDYLDKNYHLWTPQEAKDGDVLANDHHILIFKEFDYDWHSNWTPDSVKAYCGIKPNGNFELDKDNWCFCGTLHIHPATKEQRDILFQKMKEAGYEWDSNKKRLNQRTTLKENDEN